MKVIFAIATGEAIGAASRYLVMIRAAHWLGMGFPYGTVIVNVAGFFLLGVLIEGSALAWDVGQELRAFLVVLGVSALVAGMIVLRTLL